MNNTSQDRVKGIVVLMLTDKGLYETNLHKELEKEIYALINKYQITLVGNDLSELLTVKK